MTLYSYIVTHDTGFAPNPFFGYCTLACCKPGIRKTAKKDDWIVGLTPKADGNKIVYFMQVDERIQFDQYWKRFKRKRPDPQGDLKHMNGDNIYQPQPGVGYLGYRQLPSAHSKPKFGNGEDLEKMKRDLNGDHVLVSRRFAYFGSDARAMPAQLRETLSIGRGYRHLSEQVAAQFYKQIRKRNWKFGVHAKPQQWRKGDESWKGVGCGKA